MFKVEPFTNKFGQVINPGDKVVYATQSWKATHTNVGIYEGYHSYPAKRRKGYNSETRKYEYEDYERKRVRIRKQKEKDWEASCSVLNDNYVFPFKENNECTG